MIHLFISFLFCFFYNQLSSLQCSHVFCDSHSLLTQSVVHKFIFFDLSAIIKVVYNSLCFYISLSLLKLSARFGEDVVYLPLLRLGALDRNPSVLPLCALHGTPLFALEGIVDPTKLMKQSTFLWMQVS